MKYQNFETLKKNSEFKSVYQAKHSYANKYIIMYILQNGTDTNRLGVSVSKKVGNSIVRHRLARLIREAFRLNVTQVAPGYDVVVIARAGLKGKGYKETESAMLHLLKLHHIYNKEEKVHEEYTFTRGQFHRIKDAACAFIIRPVPSMPWKRSNSMAH